MGTVAERSKAMNDIRELPYPLSLKASLLLGDNKANTGNKFRFTICTAVSALVRFCAAIMLADYWRRGATDIALNAKIAKKLARPTEFNWLSVVNTLGDAKEGVVSQAAVDIVASMDNGNSIKKIFKDLFKFRTKVAHGEMFSSDELRRRADQVKGLYESFSWLGDWELIVDLGDSFYECAGMIPKKQCSNSRRALWRHRT